MKKFIALLLSLFILISLPSCSLLTEEDIERVKDAFSSSLEGIEEGIKSGIGGINSVLSEKGKENIDEEEINKKEDAREEGEKGNDDTLSVHFIDVGQADAALVECGRQYMLIDGGNKDDSDRLYSILTREGITRLDYIVGTHAHEDHIGGIPGALQACDSVGLVFCPVTDYSSKAFANFKKLACEKGEFIVPNAGDTFRLGEAVVQILGPIKTYEDTNNTSIVLKITFGETSFLFAGDMERDAEIDLLDAGVDVSADVLKVGHHGSSSSTSYLFLREVMPDYAVISVGKSNSYGHPHDEVTSRLRDAEVEVYRTDTMGDIYCVSDGKNISFSHQKY